jgi:hypothetical protein
VQSHTSTAPTLLPAAKKTNARHTKSGLTMATGLGSLQAGKSVAGSGRDRPVRIRNFHLAADLQPKYALQHRLTRLSNVVGSEAGSH